MTKQLSESQLVEILFLLILSVATSVFVTVYFMTSADL